MCWLPPQLIESGLDISNVNTIIVLDADRFGLSQLHQLRGRVGRSDKMAYAYLMYQPGKVLNEVAEKRLRAIREFTEFGSGFKVAMRDLEIRGARQYIRYCAARTYDEYRDMSFTVNSLQTQLRRCRERL